MPHALARDEQDFVAVPALLVMLVGVADADFVEAQNLVVVGVRQFVHHAPRLHVDLPRFEQLRGHGNMHTMHEVAGVAVVLQPMGLGMILHGPQLAV